MRGCNLYTFLYVMALGKIDGCFVLYCVVCWVIWKFSSSDQSEKKVKPKVNKNSTKVLLTVIFQVTQSNMICSNKYFSIFRTDDWLFKTGKIQNDFLIFQRKNREILKVFQQMKFIYLLQYISKNNLFFGFYV
jgi:hypothetical protein